ncbi:Hypothetical protein FKW44_014260, partial [Caligus rogercresseyi]
IEISQHLAMEEEKRHAMSPKEVIEFFNYPKSTSTTSGRRGTLSKRMMLITKSVSRSYAKLATEMGCSKQTIANTINKDLGYSS